MVASSIVLVLISATALFLQIQHTVENRQFRGVLPLCRVVTDRSAVALTFDGGPDPDFTPRVLEVLERYGAVATFFVLGEKIQGERLLYRRMVESGMEVGNGTWSFADLESLSVDEAWSDIQRTGQMLGPNSAPLFRPPNGQILPEQLRKVEDVGFQVIHWSLALDLADEAEGAVAVAQEARPGDVIRVHSGSAGDRAPGASEAALTVIDSLVQVLEHRGLQATTVGRLLRPMPQEVLAEPQPWFWQSGFACPR